MQTISTIEGVPGINRIAFTDEDWQGRNYLIKQLKELGLSLRIDDFGNVIGRYEGHNPDAPAIMMGSHTDSVPQGGNYDGLAGIVAALEVITDLKESKECRSIRLILSSSCAKNQAALAVPLWEARLCAVN